MTSDRPSRSDQHRTAGSRSRRGLARICKWCVAVLLVATTAACVASAWWRIEVNLCGRSEASAKGGVIQAEFVVQRSRAAPGPSGGSSLTAEPISAAPASILSYDLAQILVAQFAKEWSAFKAFVLTASMDDGGRAAALEHLGIDLGRAVCAILERRPSPDWSPDPSR